MIYLLFLLIVIISRPCVFTKNVTQFLYQVWSRSGKLRVGCEWRKIQARRTQFQVIQFKKKIYIYIYIENSNNVF